MLDWNPRQRTLVADKLFDAGNVALGAMLFGQFVSQQPFSFALALVGVVLWVTFFAISVALEKRSRP